VAGFVLRSGRDSNPRGFRLAVFKPDAPVCGARTVSVKQAAVGPRVMATVMATPKRIQRQRTKGWRMPPNTVYVGRPSLWGNQWSVSADGKWLPPGERLAFVLARYREELTHFGLLSDYAYLVSDATWDRVSAAVHATGAANMAEYAPHALRGKNLACWCPLDQPCHADILLELANR
jgi:hypothetical protein